MTVHEFADAHHFFDRTRDVFLKDEVAHSFIFSSVIALTKSYSPASNLKNSLTFLAVTDETAAIQGAALRTPQHRWIVSLNSLTATPVLLEAIEKREVHTSSARSLMLAEPAFRTVASGHANALALPNASTLNLMSVSKLAAYAGSAGLMRLAQAKDLKTAMHWSQLSAKESQLDESPSEAAEIMRKYIDHRQLFVWENEGRLKAMAAVGGFTPKTTRISQVYTDLKERGHGYGTTLVHRLTRRVLSETGGKTAVLLTDAQSPVTKHIYEKLGYKTKETFVDLRRAQSIERQNDGVMV